MSRLNQAFIKAYQTAPQTAARYAGEPSSATEQNVVPATTTVAVGSDLPTVIDAPRPAAPQPAATVMVVDSAHREIKSPHAKFGAPPSSRSAGTSGTTATEVPPNAPRATSQSSGPASQSATSVVSAPSAAKVAPAAQGPQRLAVETVKAAPIAEPVATAESRPIVLPISTAAGTWRPVFELSNFVWPELTEAILATVPGQLSTAAGELIEAARRHRKLVAIAAAQSGEGSTTITLALARALVEQQQRVVVVDAHFAAPRLSDSLGVTPQVGWEENLSGEKPLIEALIESMADHVTLLPLREPALADWRPRDLRLKATFDELRRHYDVILVDAGPLGDAKDRQHLLAWAGACRVDRALVVVDTRADNVAAMNDVELRLQGCGIAQWNFVENFAAA